MLTMTGQDVLDSLGVPALSETDLAWADTCAASAAAYVNTLPSAQADPVPQDVALGALMLATALYHRRPAGGVMPDGDPGAAAAVDSTTSRLLRLGFYQAPVIG
jgi:hypothetical protein